MNYKLQCLIGGIISVSGVMLGSMFISPLNIFVGGCLMFAGFVVIIMTVPKEVNY